MKQQRLKIKNQTIKVMSSREATLSLMPRYNAFQTGYGAQGKCKYDRNKVKRDWRKNLQGEQE